MFRNLACSFPSGGSAGHIRSTFDFAVSLSRKVRWGHVRPLLLAKWLIGGDCDADVSIFPVEARTSQLGLLSIRAAATTRRRAVTPTAPDARRPPPDKPRMACASNARCRWPPPPLGRRLSAAARWPSLAR
eukprot:scaffold7688_cov130-Isochrysis_galbana.AAC.23